jgi:hypothetical protein
MHRFIWDLHYPPPAVLQFSYPIAAVYRNTPRTPLGPWVLPGNYSLKLTVNGRSYIQPLTVKMDPRVKTAAAGLQQQFTLSLQLYGALRQDYDALQQVRGLRTQLRGLRERAGQGPVADAIVALEKEAAALEGGSGFPGAPGSGRPDQSSLARMNGELSSVLGILQGADETPTSQAAAAVGELQKTLGSLLTRWNELKAKNVPALNQQLQKVNLPAVDIR